MNERNPKRAICNSDGNEGLVEVCVFARKRGNIQSPVDIWTGRLGLLNVAQLSDRFGRVIVWDDIRGDKTIPQSIDEIFRAIEMYYGFKPKIPTNATVHVGSIGGLARSTDAFFNTLDFSFLKMAGQRIAVVDLGSCGTTGLRWLDLIPLLRRCYSHIVGIDVRVADDDVMPLTGIDDPRHPFEHLGMLVLPRVTELLGQIAFADEDRADARHLRQDVG